MRIQDSVIPKGSVAAARTRLPLPYAFAAVAAVIGLALFASATPSALYGVYEARWHFSTPVLTLVYGIYAIGVLASLLLAGGLSDQVGRRPVLLGSLALLLAAMGLFLLARSVEWLFVARALQGLATGGALAAAGAALLELHPRGDTQHASLINGVASTAGIAFGALISAVVVQFLPDPRMLPFVIVAALIVALLSAMRLLPGDRRRLRRPASRPEPHLPPVRGRGGGDRAGGGRRGAAHRDPACIRRRERLSGSPAAQAISSRRARIWRPWRR
jgi:MFS family permease